MQNHQRIVGSGSKNFGIMIALVHVRGKNAKQLGQDQDESR